MGEARVMLCVDKKNTKIQKVYNVTGGDNCDIGDGVLKTAEEHGRLIGGEQQRPEGRPFGLPSRWSRRLEEPEQVRTTSQEQHLLLFVFSASTNLKPFCVFSHHHAYPVFHVIPHTLGITAQAYELPHK